VIPVSPSTPRSDFPTGTIGELGENSVFITGSTSGLAYDACLGQSSMHALMGVDETGRKAELKITANNGVSSPSGAVVTFTPIEDSETKMLLAYTLSITSSMYSNCTTEATMRLDGSSRGIDAKDFFGAELPEQSSERSGERSPSRPRPTRYNCFTKERWSSVKRDWCCRVKGLGCRPPMRAHDEGEHKQDMTHEKHEEDKEAGVTTAIALAGGVGDRLKEQQHEQANHHHTTPNSTSGLNAEFLGEYEWEEGSCDATRCCCGRGVLMVTPGKNSSIVQLNSAVIANNKEGRDPCRGQKRLVASFGLTNHSFARYALTEPLLVEVMINLSKPERGAMGAMANPPVDHHLTLSSRIQTDPVCTMRATRSSPSSPSSSSSSSSPSSPSSPISPSSPVHSHSSDAQSKEVTTTQDDHTHTSASVSIADIKNFMGHWEVTPGCVPSKDCCCGTDRLVVQTTAPEALALHEGPDHDHDHSQMPVLKVNAALDGGKGCYNIKSLTGPCKVIGKNVGVCEVILPGIETNNPPKIYLRINGNGTELVMNSTLYGQSTCATTKAVRVSPNKPKTKNLASTLFPSLAVSLTIFISHFI